MDDAYQRRAKTNSNPELENIRQRIAMSLEPKIVLPAVQGLANDVIAARLETPRQILSKWRKRFALARLPGFEEQPRGGRPRPVFPRVSSPQ